MLEQVVEIERLDDGGRQVHVGHHPYQADVGIALLRYLNVAFS